MKTVPSNVQIVTQDQAVDVSGLPQEVSLALADIAIAARERLLAMSVAAGMAVIAAMFEAEVSAVTGPKGRRIPERVAVRNGTGKGSARIHRFVGRVPAWLRVDLLWGVGVRVGSDIRRTRRLRRAGVQGVSSRF